VFLWKNTHPYTISPHPPTLNPQKPTQPQRTSNLNTNPNGKPLHSTSPKHNHKQTQISTLQRKNKRKKKTPQSTKKKTNMNQQKQRQKKKKTKKPKSLYFFLCLSYFTHKKKRQTEKPNAQLTRQTSTPPPYKTTHTKQKKKNNNLVTPNQNETHTTIKNQTLERSFSILPLFYAFFLLFLIPPRGSPASKILFLLGTPFAARRCAISFFPLHGPRNPCCPLPSPGLSPNSLQAGDALVTPPFVPFLLLPGPAWLLLCAGSFLPRC